MITTSKTAYCSVSLRDSSDAVGLAIYTKDQSLKNQPIVWLVHGSGGVSSAEDLWKSKALDVGYTVAIVDSYSSRGTLKKNWDGKDSLAITGHGRANDLLSCREWLVENKSIVPFADMDANIAVGFSNGGTAALHCQSDRFRHRSAWLHMSYALYPGVHPFESDFASIDGNKCHLFVGELDQWTTAAQAKKFCDSNGSQLTVLPAAHHSYSKPGVANTYKNVINLGKIPIPAQLSDDIINGNFNMLDYTQGDISAYKGVYVEYNSQATETTMSMIFGGKNDTTTA
jgi:dienelactone hydrolase